MAYNDLKDLDTSLLSIQPLSLFPDVSYSYTTTLEQKTYKISILWTVFNESWSFSLYDEDEEPILLNQALVPAFPIDVPILAGLMGYFTLIPVGENSNGKWDDLKWDLYKNYTLVYVTKTELI